MFTQNKRSLRFMSYLERSRQQNFPLLFDQWCQFSANYQTPHNCKPTPETMLPKGLSRAGRVLCHLAAIGTVITPFAPPVIELLSQTADIFPDAETALTSASYSHPLGQELSPHINLCPIEIDPYFPPSAEIFSAKAPRKEQEIFNANYLEIATQQTDLALILLNETTTYLLAIQQLKAAGAHIQHVFPPNVLIGQVPASLTLDTLASAGVATLHREPVNPDELEIYGLSAQKAGRAWNDLLVSLAPEIEANQITADQVGADLINDALIPPDLPSDGQKTSTSDSHEPDYYQTSEFMIGKVAVGIILPESDGSIDPSTEDWTEQEREQVYSEILSAAHWWADHEPKAQLTFIYDDHFSQPIPTSYEPISRPQSDQNLWIGEVMTRLGYDHATSYFTNVRNYVNDLRKIYQTDWAFAIFVVDSSNDADNYFATGYFAYAYPGGPFMVMTYGNNHYDIDNMNAVTGHEMGHIFLALDQYPSARVPCDTRSGYLDVETQNSLYSNCASNEPSIMRGGTYPYTYKKIDYYAKGQVGWRDSDNDGVLDPIDTSTEVILTQETPPEAGQTIIYSGNATDIPFPSTRRRPTTINRITNMSYRLKNGLWQPVSPTDGSFDSIKEKFTFTLPPLIPGTYPLDLLVNTSLGGSRIISSADTIIIPIPESWNVIHLPIIMRNAN